MKESTWLHYACLINRREEREKIAAQQAEDRRQIELYKIAIREFEEGKQNDKIRHDADSAAPQTEKGNK